MIVVRVIPVIYVVVKHLVSINELLIEFCSIIELFM